MITRADVPNAGGVASGTAAMGASVVDGPIVIDGVAEGDGDPDPPPPEPDEALDVVNVEVPEMYVYVLALMVMVPRVRT